MRRICTCSRGINFSNRTAVVHNYTIGEDICSHCGGIVPSNTDDITYGDSYKSFYRRAKSCSINGNHEAAIGFYKEALRLAWHDKRKCEMLSAIAREYEEIGDYASAEDYWMRCCDVESYGMIASEYTYTAGKGDFLYRRGRYCEAIESYNEALKSLEGLKDREINLTYYARITHFIIDSYDKLGDDNHKEKYHNELKHAVNRFICSGRANDKTSARYISEMAWDIYLNDAIIDEALILMDSAIELHPDCPADYYNRKAIILKYGFRYEDALKYFDIALAKEEFNETFLKNRMECEAVCIKSKLEIEVLFRRIEPKHLDMINRALKILPDGFDNVPYLHVKAEILGQLGDPVKAWICRYIAAERYDEVEKIEKQLKKMKSGGTYINITGIHYYQGFTPFKEGTIVDLIREPGNPHDRDAIRVEINGETVGYVANNKYTLIKEVKSATGIKNTQSKQAEVQFILFNEWVIAKLI